MISYVVYSCYNNIQVSWLHPHPDRHFYGKPIEVWSLQGTDTSYPASFLPVERIAGRCVVNTSTVHLSKTKEKVTVVMPLLGVGITRGLTIQYHHDTYVTIRYYCDFEHIAIFYVSQFITFFPTSNCSQFQIMSPKGNFVNICFI